MEVIAMHIYILANKINGKKYVGKTEHTDPWIRINEHLELFDGTCPAIHNAIKKYGRDNFDVEIISYPGASSEALAAIEIWQIKKNGSKAPDGYNLTDGGDGVGGHIWTEQHRKNASISQKKRFKDPEVRRNASISQKKRYSLETSEAAKGRSERHKRFWEDPKERKAQSERTKKRFEAPEEREKISVATKIGMDNQTIRKLLCIVNSSPIEWDPYICRLYTKYRMSTPQIAKYYGCSYTTVNNTLKRNGIKIRSHTESRNAPMYKTKHTSHVLAQLPNRYL